MPFDWLHSITQTPTYSIILYGNIIFYLYPLFQEHNEDIKHGLGVHIHTHTGM